MTPVPVIFDTNSLIYFTNINARYPMLNMLKNIFSAVHVPDDVYNEYYKGATKDQERNKIINLIDSNDKFWKKCTSYDTIAKVFYETYKEIDKGEAAALAQQTKVYARYIISDDIKFEAKAKELKPNATIITIIHLLVILDIHRYISNWADCIKTLHLHRRFNSSDLRDAYILVAKWYDIEISSQMLTSKCSFKLLGIQI